jgi:antitoxin CcdA
MANAQKREVAMSTSARGGAARRPVNLSLPATLVETARALGINTSLAAEAGIAAAVRRAQEEAWLGANRAAIDEHAAWVDQNGLPLEPAWPE